jgi:hypothetical protein
MSTFLKFTFIAFALVAVLIGLLLLVAPGRFLGYFGWAPVDPLISRMLGAALLGLAWGSFNAARRPNAGVARSLLQVNAIFCTLATLGMLRNMLGAGWPYMVWFILALYAVFAVLFIINWLLLRK